VTASLHPFVSIVMPALNEEHYIEAAVASVLPREGTLEYELLVLDGGSSDRTCEIVKALSAREPRIKLLVNDRRIQSAAVNIASEACDPRAEILVRADCHAEYPGDFAARCAEALRKTASASVVVPMHAVGRQPLQRAIAATQNSRLGNGGSAHRVAGASGYVEHGHHAAFDRAVFRSLGGYDETAPFNEDAEYDARVAASGRRIYLDGALTIRYFPRTSFRALARQYFNHGWGRANTLIKHAQAPRLRQMLPVLMLLITIVGAPLWPFFGAIAVSPLALYVLACLAWAVALSVSARDATLVLAAPAAIVMHLSWATGFLYRCAERFFPKLFCGFLPSRVAGSSPEGKIRHKA
jgi:succinoglycan biosynthesis protein ExoA